MEVVGSPGCEWSEVQPEFDPSFGVIITNRNRSGPVDVCLASLAAQDRPATWVLLSDLSSGQSHRAALTGLAERYGASYLRIEHDGAWNKSLAFNTAFRLALRGLPAVTHVIQLDADMILHPRLLAKAAAVLSAAASPLSSSFYCAPRWAPPELDPWDVPGDPVSYARMLAQCGRVRVHAVGTFMVLPCGWLAGQRGFDETFTGWGHEDTEMWHRVKRSLTYDRDVSGTLLIHQWHQPQAGADDVTVNWTGLAHRMANPDQVVNPAGWGGGRITESVLRPGPLHALDPR
jgi:glycosyl transferase family 2